MYSVKNWGGGARAPQTEESKKILVPPRPPPRTAYGGGLAPKSGGLAPGSVKVWRAGGAWVDNGHCASEWASEACDMA